MTRPLVTGFRCATCGTVVDVGTAWPWRCPAAGESRHHVLRIERTLAPLRPPADPNPLVAYDHEMAWAAFAAAHGMDASARVALVREVDDAIAAVDGTGMRITPCLRADVLSDALEFASTGGVWVKDHTHDVAGSHKARHLVTILLHLLAAERLGLAPSVRPPLAIASCGNAALAAATLAAAVRWPIRVFVPPDANPTVLARLAVLGAEIETCARSAGGPAGDPCVHRFRAAVAAGAVPFGVQGPENALCLDGGRTLGFEIYESLGHWVDRVFVQVGGGALVTGVGDGLRIGGVHPRVHAVQTEGCAPLERAWRRALADPGAAARAEHMTPWATEPRSVATGILDDETYDWLGAADAMRGGGGWPVVAPESDVVRAHELAHAHTTIDADHTGTAGLAGLVTVRDQIADDERVVVIFSGVQRG